MSPRSLFLNEYLFYIYNEELFNPVCESQGKTNVYVINSNKTLRYSKRTHS